MERLCGGWEFTGKGFAPDSGLTPDPLKSGY